MSVTRGVHYYIIYYTPKTSGTTTTRGKRPESRVSTIRDVTRDRVRNYRTENRARLYTTELAREPPGVRCFLHI